MRREANGEKRGTCMHLQIMGSGGAYPWEGCGGLRVSCSLVIDCLRCSVPGNPVGASRDTVTFDCGGLPIEAAKLAELTSAATPLDPVQVLETDPKRRSRSRF